MENKGFSYLTSEYRNKYTQYFAYVPDVTVFGNVMNSELTKKVDV